MLGGWSAASVNFFEWPLAAVNSCASKAAKTQGYEASATIRTALEWAMMAMNKIPKMPQRVQRYCKQVAGRGGHQPVRTFKFQQTRSLCCSSAVLSFNVA